MSRAAAAQKDVQVKTKADVLHKGHKKLTDVQKSLLKDLNKPQQEAVQHQGSPLLIVAGVGTGKT